MIASGVGGITESDATLAAASKALIIGFNVRADASARKVIEASGLDLRYFSIIYDVIDQVKQAATGLMGMEVREDILGTAEVRDVFRSSKFGAIAGCMVVEGTVKRHKPIRVLRDNVVIFEGELESLRRFKENVDEVRNGMECGIGVKQYNDVKPGDQIECFERIEVASAPCNAVSAEASERGMRKYHRHSRLAALAAHRRLMPSHAFHRTDRINAELRRELGTLVHALVRDHALPQASVSDVEVTRDLDVATVWVTALQPERSAEVVKALKEAAKDLRHELGALHAHAPRAGTALQIRRLGRSRANGSRRCCAAIARRTIFSQDDSGQDGPSS